MLSKQAKALSAAELGRLLAHVAATRYPKRDRVIVLLSFKAGLRAKEIAALKWAMVTDASGNLSDAIALPNQASKGTRGGRTIPINRELAEALAALKESDPVRAQPSRPVIFSERGSYTANGVAHWFADRYSEIGIEGASSHSGRRTFVTGLAKRISEAGGSLRDVQQLAGHANLGTTQRYVDGSEPAKRRAVDLL